MLNLSNTAAADDPTPETPQLVFRSTDDGQSWQDISAGLPEELSPSTFFIGNDQLFLGASDGLYRKHATNTGDRWKKILSLQPPLSALLARIGEKEPIFERQVATVSAGTGSVIAFSGEGRFFQKLDNVEAWTPIFTNFDSHRHKVRSVFTAGDGSIFIGCDNGLFKSTDQGDSWKHVMQNGWVIRMAESDGVLLCTSLGGILRSTDGGEEWETVLYEGGVGIAIEVIEGGFAAITYNGTSRTRRVRTSTDGGKTWQAIDEGLPPSPSISSIKQVGDYFYCGHPAGIYRSADRGASWELLLPTIGEKVFDLSVSGEVLYAMLRNRGC
jgi:photosystem II stability/assembly factor-like uncharacterized protein